VVELVDYETLGGLKKTGVFCATSWVPHSHPINPSQLTQTYADTLLAPTASVSQQEMPHIFKRHHTAQPKLYTTMSEPS